MVLGLADNDFHNLAILPKVRTSAEGFEQFIFLDRGAQTGNIDEILLDDPQTSEMLAAQGIGFSLLRLFLLRGNGFLLAGCQLGLPCRFPALPSDLQFVQYQLDLLLGPRLAEFDG